MNRPQRNFQFPSKWGFRQMIDGEKHDWIMIGRKGEKLHFFSANLITTWLTSEHFEFHVSRSYRIFFRKMKRCSRRNRSSTKIYPEQPERRILRFASPAAPTTRTNKKVVERLMCMRVKELRLRKYSVDRMDVAMNMEKRAEWAILASAARLAHCSLYNVTSTLSTL